MTPFSSPPDPIAYRFLVWEMVRKIPAGQVATYGQIARLIPLPPGVDPDSYRSLGPRWVGGAMASCPADVPWQRVVNSEGKISLRGGGENKQRELLEEEGVHFDDRERIDLKIYTWPGPD
jgi:methylated-DNA-protein-cysteine methyltransferase related protein